MHVTGEYSVRRRPVLHAGRWRSADREVAPVDLRRAGRGLPTVCAAGRDEDQADRGGATGQAGCRRGRRCVVEGRSYVCWSHCIVYSLC